MVDHLNSSKTPDNTLSAPRVHKYSNLRYLRRLRKSGFLAAVWSKLRKVEAGVMSLGKKVLFYCCLYVEEELQVMTSPNDVTSKSDQMLQIQPDENSTEKFVDNL